MQKNTKTIVVTGGHVTPALAVIEVLRERGWNIVWLGEKRAVSKGDAKTLEYQTLPTIDIPFYTVKSAKLHRRFIYKSFFSFWRLCVGYLQSIILLRKISPKVVLSFGSYVSIPVAYAARTLNIPIVIHEQTTTSGLANRHVASLAKYIALSFQESNQFFPASKTIVTGNPVRNAFFKVGKKKEDKKPGKTPIIYITGGSRGSQTLNEVVFQVLPSILEKAKVYHQTGSLDFENIKGSRGKLAKGLKKNYFIAATFTPQEVEQRFEEADFLISRSGANTVSELMVTGTPAILIPIPWVESNEQTRNAELLSKVGAGILLPQEKLNKESLLEVIENMTKNISKFQSNAKKLRSLIPEDAALQITLLVEKAAKLEER